MLQFFHLLSILPAVLSAPALASDRIPPDHATGQRPVIPLTSAPAGQRALMDVANNGVPVTLIAPASPAGVSRNQFSQFNVSPDGLIFNNSPSHVQTRLGGWIHGNMQLAAPASIILTEVVAPQSSGHVNKLISHLNGPMEVAGQQADMVIANPNGIYCNGCSFINTGQATLTTGQPLFDGIGAGADFYRQAGAPDGAITGYDVRGGEIRIQQQGLTAANLEQLDLIARNLVVDGELWTTNLRVITGANQLMTEHRLQLHTQPGTGPVPHFAIDVREMGGMYANNVFIVSTEKGLGVNSTGRIAALQGNLFLSSDGELTVADSYSAIATQFNSTGNTTLTGLTSGDNSIRLTSAGTLTQLGYVEAKEQLSIKANTLDNQGILIQHGTNALRIDTQNKVTNHGEILSGGDILVTANSPSGTIYADQGTFSAAGNTQLQANTLTLTATRLSSGRRLTLNAGDGGIHTSESQLHAGSDIRADTSGPVYNTNGDWLAQQQLTVQANTFNNNKGSMHAAGALNLTIAGEADNTSAQLLSTDAVHLSAEHVINGQNALIASNTTTSIQAGSLNNDGEISAADITLSINNTLNNNQLINGTSTHINAGQTNNTGQIYGDTLALQNTLLNNSATGVIAARDKLFLGGTSVNNTDGGLIYANNNLHMAGSFNDAGQPQGYIQNLLNTSSRIDAGGDMQLQVQHITNRNNGLQTENRTTIQALNTTLLQPFGHPKRYPLSELGLDEHWEKVGRYAIPNSRYPFAQFGWRPKKSVWWFDCSNKSRDEPCTKTHNYPANDPHWALFNIRQADVSDLTKPALPKGNNCLSGSYRSSGSNSCEKYWKEMDRYDTEVTRRSMDQNKALDEAIKAFNTDIASRWFTQWFEYRVRNKIVSEPILIASDPAKIQAGGNLTLAGQGTKINDNSHIIAGGAVTAEGTQLENRSLHGIRSSTDQGEMRERRVVRRRSCMGCYSIRHSAWVDTTGAPAQTSIELGDVLVREYQATHSPPPQQDSTSLRIPPLPTTHQISPALPRVVVLTTQTPLTLPTARLFTIRPAPANPVLVETDPLFTKYKNFISSDYMLQQLAKNPERTLKRLGDGFYEQQLINDQINALTGQRFLSGYHDNETQFKQLMDQGLVFARQYQLTPGLALSAEHMASLTSDIVWLTQHTVTLPDGKTSQVLVPQVYLRRLQDGDLHANGSIISGNSITIRTAHDIVNNGTIAAGTGITLHTDKDIRMDGGTLQGASVLAHAGRDLHHASGRISGSSTTDSEVQLSAGRDILLQTRLLDSTGQTGTSQRRTADRIATIKGSTVSLSALRDASITGAALHGDNQLTLHAGRNMHIAAADEYLRLTPHQQSGPQYQEERLMHQASALSAQDITLTAGHHATLTGSTVAATQDIRLTAADITISAAPDYEKHDSRDASGGHHSRAMRERQRHSGGQLLAGRDITLQASGGENSEGNITLQGASLHAATGENKLIAANDIHLRTHKATDNIITRHSEEEVGLFSSTRTTRRHTSKTTGQLGNTITGNSIVAQAGRDMALQGSSLIAKNDVTLTAGNNINIAAATTTGHRVDQLYIKESGLLTGNGNGISIGERNTSTERDQRTQIQQLSRSMVSAADGQLNIRAGANATITGSDIQAATNIHLAAGSITVDPGSDKHQYTHTHQITQDGITLALGGAPATAVSTMNSIPVSLDFPDDKAPDSRLSAVAAATAAMAAQIAARDIAANGIGITLTAGHSASEQQSTRQQTQHSGSTIRAGQKLILDTTNSNNASKVGDSGQIRITGSELIADNIELLARSNLTVQATADSTQQHGTSSKQSAAAGLSANFSKSGIAFGVHASAGAGAGKHREQNKSQRLSQIQAGQQLTLQSDGNTTLQGARLHGKRITGNIGSYLHIDSVQDTARADSHDHLLSGQATIGVGFSAAASANISRLNNDYASVQQQSGIFSGDDGFNVQVNGDTHLHGGVISSTQAAVDQQKNTFSTGTLSHQNITNRSRSSGISLTASTTLPMAIALSKEEYSITRSDISGGTIAITNKAAQQARTGISADHVIGSLHRNIRSDTPASNNIARPASTQELRSALTVYSNFAALAASAIGDYATGKLQEANELSKQAGQEPDAHKRTELLEQAQTLQQNWKENGPARLALHTVVGGLTGGMPGALGTSISTLITPSVATKIASLEIPDALKNTLTLAASTATGAAAGGATGAASAATATANNFLTHQQASAFNDELAACRKQARGCQDSDINTITSKYHTLSNANISKTEQCIFAGNTACVQQLHEQAASSRAVTGSLPPGWTGLERQFAAQQDNIHTHGSVKGAASLFGTDLKQAQDVAQLRQSHCTALSGAACDALVTQALNTRIYRGAALAAIGNATVINLVNRRIKLPSKPLTDARSVEGKIQQQQGTSAKESTVDVANQSLAKDADTKKAGSNTNNAAADTPAKPKSLTAREAEIAVEKEYGSSARPQISFLDRKEVKYGTPGSVRPDLAAKDSSFSVEVKLYDIQNNSNGLINSIAKQAIKRAVNLPKGMTQEIVIDVREQVTTKAQREHITNKIVQKSNGHIKHNSIRFKTK